MASVLLGIDIGTSGCKALLLSVTGDILATSTATYGLSQPRVGWTQPGSIASMDAPSTSTIVADAISWSVAVCRW